MSTRPLAGVARLVIGRPRLVVGVWFALVAVLAFGGKDLSKELNLHLVYVDGSATQRAHEISQREFGGDSTMIVMLRGPAGKVEQQGQALAGRLDVMPDVLVVSPWSGGGSVDGLNPSPGVAALIVRVEDKEGESVVDGVRPVQRQVDASVSAPVRASVAGFPAIAESLRSAGEDATRLGEMIALPVLLLVLLFVFRSILAAAIPVFAGGAVVAATPGVLSVIQHFAELDLFALSMMGMIGLALGVDYSLLVVSRFREERRAADVSTAATATVMATARSVLPAGGGLIFAMLVTGLLVPGTIVHSAVIAIVTVALLSMVSAICVVPAALVMLDSRLDRWSLPVREGSTIAPLRWSRRIVGHPWAVAMIVVALVIASGWAFTLDSGSASVGFLPSGDKGRQQQEEVEEALGPGWIAPMEIVVDGRGHPLTSPGRLRALAAFQREVEHDPGVETMAGLKQIAHAAERVDGAEATLVRQEHGFEKLERGIAQAHRGAEAASGGLLAAAGGSSRLSEGLGSAGAGAGALATALDAVRGGSDRLSQGLGRADRGSGDLAKGTARASNGAGRLAHAIGEAEEQVGETLGSGHLLDNAMRSGENRLAEAQQPLRLGEERLAAARQALQRMTSGRADPEYAAALQAVEEASEQLSGGNATGGEASGSAAAGVAEGLERANGQFGLGRYLAGQVSHNGQEAKDGIEKLSRASEKLDRGLQRLASGGRRLSHGIDGLSSGGERLSPALLRLGNGAERLSDGLGRLRSGADRLSGGLGTGTRRSRLLSGGLGRIEGGLEKQGGGGSGLGLSELRRRSPGMLHSAYFVLASLDGAKPERRSQVGELINLDRGGMDARMLVVPTDDANSAGARETRGRVDADAERLARGIDAEVLVGGVGPTLMDINDAGRNSAPGLRLALALVTFLILVPVMRSLTVPLLAALINLLTVGASFGILSLLFNNSLLGGPGFVDVSVVTATLMVMFGLAIDYEVFVFARIREEYLRTGSTSAAVENGLDRTAHVVTGAALIMISVFLAFSVSDLMSIRNFGIAQATAIFIDAFLIRLIVVPALMNRLGRWCWWMPKWIDRRWPSGRSPAPPAQG